MDAKSGRNGVSAQFQNAEEEQRGEKGSARRGLGVLLVIRHKFSIATQTHVQVCVC